MTTKNETNTKSFNYSMILGTIGMALIVAALARGIIVGEDFLEFAPVWLGLMFMLEYIYKLEDKAGVKKKLVWIRAVLLMAILVISAIAYAL